MSIKTQLSNDQSTYIIQISGMFDFTMLNAFRQAYDNSNERGKKYVIDMRDVMTIDSSALGMLLNMKRTLNCDDKAIKIINCNQFVKKIFQITHFEKKFSIE